MRPSIIRCCPEKRLIADPVARLMINPETVMGTKYRAVRIGSRSLTCWKLEDNIVVINPSFKITNESTHYSVWK